MQLTVTGQHFDVSASLKDYVEEKLTKLDRHSEKLIRAHIILKIEKNRHIAEATLHVSGHDFFAKTSVDDMYASIDATITKLDSQILKHKNKLINKNHK